jgi:hypothetical protein
MKAGISRANGKNSSRIDQKPPSRQRLGAKEARIVYMTYSRSVSESAISRWFRNRGGNRKRTQRMAAAQLWLLCVFCRKLVTDAVKKLHVTLLRILL